MSAKNSFIDCLKRLDSDPEGRLRAREQAALSGIKVHGKTIPFSYIPLFVDTHTEKCYENMVRVSNAILSKVTKHYLENPAYRTIFGFAKEMEALICLPCGYEQIVPVGRYDYFFDEESGNYWVCEFNTDGSSGMSRDHAVTNAILSSFGGEKFFEAYEAAPFPTAWRIAAELLRIYRTDPDAVEHPVFCITDFREEGVMSDFEQFISAFHALGVRVRFTDIRELSFDGKRLFDRNDGTTIHAIYRRAVTSVVLEHLKECTALLRAVAARKVVLLGHFRTALAHSKMIHYALLHPMTAELLTEEENVWVHKHIPATYPLDASFAATTRFKDVLKHKDNWIVKPMEGFASHEVISGMDTDVDKWNMLIRERLDRGYLVQQFCYRPCVEVMNAESGKIEKMPFMLGIFQAGGHFAGCYSRAGYGGVIDYNHGGLLVSTVRVSPKAGDNDGE